jgi:hypothetical protein
MFASVFTMILGPAIVLDLVVGPAEVRGAPESTT